MNARIAAGVGCFVVLVAACGSEAPSEGTAGGQGGSGSGQATANVSATIVASSTGATTSTTGVGSTSDATSTSGPSSSTGVVTDCHVFAPDSCADCLEVQCCNEVLDCANDAECFDCIIGNGGAECDTNQNLLAVWGCAVDHCGEAYDWEGGYAGNPCNVVPPGWTCADDLYNSTYYDDPNATCECYTCGSFDPDCFAGAPDDAACPGGFCTVHCACVPDGSACQ